MNFINQIQTQLMKMSETQKDIWILNQAKILSENMQEDFLLSLSGKKKIIGIPTWEEIDQFCKQVECGHIYFEYETHYYEFDDNGRYMDDWKVMYNDVCDAIPFLNRIFTNCHYLLLLEEYQMISDIMSRVCKLQFAVWEAEDSEDSPEDDVLSLLEVDRENMFVRKLKDVGTDWMKAVNQLIKGETNKERAQKLIEMFEYPICHDVKPRILIDEGVPQEIFAEMAIILEEKIADLELIMKDKFSNEIYSHEKYQLKNMLERKKGVLQDLRVKCLKNTFDVRGEKSKLAACWEQIQEKIRWLNFERYIDDQIEIEEILNICEALVKTGELKDENWHIRKKVLQDIVDNHYYHDYCCIDAMRDLSEHLCTSKEEYLEFAEILEKSQLYNEKAAYLYYQYGRDDKYVSYLENHLNRNSKEYSALITYYLEHNQHEDARRVAELGLERCREDLTTIFICLLLDAQRECDDKRFQKLYASAKRRKKVDIKKVKVALK